MLTDWDVCGNGGKVACVCHKNILVWDIDTSELSAKIELRGKHCGTLLNDSGSRIVFVLEENKNQVSVHDTTGGGFLFNITCEEEIECVAICREDYYVVGLLDG